MLKIIAYGFREDIRRFNHTIEPADAQANLRKHHYLALCVERDCVRAVQV